MFFGVNYGWNTGLTLDFPLYVFLFWGWIIEDDRMDPGFSSTEYISNLLWVNYGEGQDGPWIFLYWIYIQFVVGELWRRTGWTLDFLLPGYSLSGFIELSTTALRSVLLKGTMPRVFDFRIFLRISFPQAPEYTIRAVSYLFENSQRYSQLKLHHRVSLTLVANEIIFFRKVLIIFWNSFV